MSVHASAAGRNKLPAGVNEARWRPDATAPQGINVENLRRRGIDRLRLAVTSTPRKGLLSRLFTGSGAITQTLVFADQKLHMEFSGKPKAEPRKEVFNFRDVSTATIKGKAGKHQALALSAGGHTFDIGAGLPCESLQWLRDRILLEVAGLVWKPVYNVGRRTTRATTTENDDSYADWSSGTPNRLIEAFLEEAPAKALALDAAVGAANWGDVKKTVHWLKSSCASVGAAQLSELCQRMEIEIEINDISRMQVLAEKFKSEFAGIVATLTRIRDSSAGDADAAARSASQTTETNAADSELPAVTDRGPGTDRPLSGMRVLVVEDSLVNQLLAADYLEEAGCEVMTASDGAEAIDKFVQNVFDVIFMDCQMPGMDGRDAVKIIRQREIETMRAMTPVVALTAHALPDDRALCLAAGMNDYMSKPYTRDEIIGMAKWWSGKNPEVPHEEAAAMPEADAA